MIKFDYKKQAQEYYRKVPVIILGSGASAAYGLPVMSELAEYLVSNIDTVGLVDAEYDAWNQFSLMLQNGENLESALQQLSISKRLTEKITKKTWEFISFADNKVFDESLQNPNKLQLSNLIKCMFQSSIPQINIVTTNYDRLAEYACDFANFDHFSGFANVFFRQFKFSKQDKNTKKRLVNIWKVHGSLDWFKSPQKDTIALSNIRNIPDNYEPQIVTPGIQKYEKTHHEPFRTIMNESDKAIIGAKSYLCIGYGFNDDHIEQKLIANCLRNEVPIVIITYSLTDSARKLIFEGRVKNYLAIERGEHNEQSIIYTSLSDTPIVVDANIWSLEGYISLVI